VLCGQSYAAKIAVYLTGVGRPAAECPGESQGDMDFGGHTPTDGKNSDSFI